MNIRNAKQTDQKDIQSLYMRAFPSEENALVSTLALDLLKQEQAPATLSFIFEDQYRILGHVAFSPLFSNNMAIGYNLSPLAVMPDHQKKGIGSQLVNFGLGRLREQKIGMVCVYGDPNYYSRFGFEAELGQRFVPPYALKYPFGWQAMSFSGQIPPSPVHFTCVPALSKPELW